VVALHLAGRPCGQSRGPPGGRPRRLYFLARGQPGGDAAGAGV
jgi:hypothetical protein